MAPGQPFFREAGEGPGVVCLHSNASTSSQWRSLMDLIEPKFRVLAVDSYGAGKSPPWPAREIRLADEAALIDPVLERAGPRCALVGHSYGAAVALIAALRRPDRVRALALYEPTIFALVDAEKAPPNDADGIRHAAAEAAAAIAAGDADRAAQRFIDYWMGEESWARTPEARKPAIAASMANVAHWERLLFGEPTPLAAFSRLDIPVLYIMGERSPASSRAVGRLLTGTLPRVQAVELEGVGHMGPLTHPERVNDLIAAFLGSVRGELGPG